MAKSVTALGKRLYASIVAAKLDDYGVAIPTSWVHQIVGIIEPLSGTRKQFQTLALQELGIVDFVRNKLLDRGMYLKGTDTGYRILLLSENADQIEIYRRAAMGKLNRSRKLAQSSPPAAFAGTVNPLASIQATRNSIRKKPVKKVLPVVAPPMPPGLTTP